MEFTSTYLEIRSQAVEAWRKADALIDKALTLEYGTPAYASISADIRGAQLVAGTLDRQAHQMYLDGTAFATCVTGLPFRGDGALSQATDLSLRHEAGATDGLDTRPSPAGS